MARFTIAFLIVLLLISGFTSFSIVENSDSRNWFSSFLQNFSTEILGALVIVLGIDFFVRPQIEKASQRTALTIELHKKWHSESMHKTRRVVETLIRNNFKEGKDEGMGTTELNHYLTQVGREEDARQLFRHLHLLEELGKLLKTDNLDRDLVKAMFSDYIDDYILTEHLIDLMEKTIQEERVKTPVWLAPTAYLVSQIKTVQLDENAQSTLDKALSMSQ